MATKPKTPAEPVQATPAKKDPALCHKKGCSAPIFSSERVTRAVLCEPHYWAARQAWKDRKASRKATQ